MIDERELEGLKRRVAELEHNNKINNSLMEEAIEKIDEQRREIATLKYGGMLRTDDSEFNDWFIRLYSAGGKITDVSSAWVGFRGAMQRVENRVSAQNDVIFGQRAGIVGLELQMDALRSLCGCVEDGSSTVVKIAQDDATKDWVVHVGDK
jgi:hypothetical protein